MERVWGTGWQVLNAAVSAAVGDPALAAVIEGSAPRSTRRLAVVTVDLGDEAKSVRQAFVDADTDTTFEIGSITKGLTGFLVADAVERGELSLDTRLEDVLPQLADAAAGQATLREVCTHTSGLPRLAPGLQMMLGGILFGLLGTDPYRGISTEELLRSAARARRGPGMQYGYSNLGGALAGTALSVAAGMSYPKLLSERVLDPLEMTRTSAATDLLVRRGRSRRGRVVANWQLDGYAPAGGVVSTAADLTRLCRAMLDRSVPGASAMDPVRTPDPQEPQRRQGLFWVNDAVSGSDRTAVWHNGQTGGYSSYLAVYPQVRRAVVVLSSVAGSTATERIANAAVRRMIEGF